MRTIGGIRCTEPALGRLLMIRERRRLTNDREDETESRDVWRHASVPDPLEMRQACGWRPS